MGQETSDLRCRKGVIFAHCLEVHPAYLESAYCKIGGSTRFRTFGAPGELYGVRVRSAFHGSPSSSKLWEVEMIL
jgi:hypothetical protein